MDASSSEDGYYFPNHFDVGIDSGHIVIRKFLHARLSPPEALALAAYLAQAFALTMEMPELFADEFGLRLDRIRFGK